MGAARLSEGETAVKQRSVASKPRFAVSSPARAVQDGTPADGSVIGVSRAGACAETNVWVSDSRLDAEGA